MEDATIPVQVPGAQSERSALPPLEPIQPPPVIRKNTSWGVIFAILLILAMIVVGAFYAWGKRLSEQPGYTAVLSSYPQA